MPLFVSIKYSKAAKVQIGKIFESSKSFGNYFNTIHRVSSNENLKERERAKRTRLTLVTFLYVGQLQAGLAAQAATALVAFAGVRWIAVVPDEDGYFDVQLLPLDHVRHRCAVRKLQIAAQYDGLVDVR